MDLPVNLFNPYNSFVKEEQTGHAHFRDRETDTEMLSVGPKVQQLLGEGAVIEPQAASVAGLMAVPRGHHACSLKVRDSFSEQMGLS